MCVIDYVTCIFSGLFYISTLLSIIGGLQFRAFVACLRRSKLNCITQVLIRCPTFFSSFSIRWLWTFWERMRQLKCQGPIERRSRYVTLECDGSALISRLAFSCSYFDALSIYRVSEKQRDRGGSFSLQIGISAVSFKCKFTVRLLQYKGTLCRRLSPIKKKLNVLELAYRRNLVRVLFVSLVFFLVLAPKQSHPMPSSRQSGPLILRRRNAARKKRS